MSSIRKLRLSVFGPVICCACFTLAATHVSADGGEVNAGFREGVNGKSVVLLLLVAKDEPGAERERQFATQLALSLERFRVETISEGLGDFPDLQLPERLELIKPLAAQHDSLATFWLEESGEDLTLLHMVALDTGRALVRIVEAPRSPDTVLELALAAQELLGQAYLLSRRSRPPAVEQVVTEVTREAVSILKTPETLVEAKPSNYPALAFLPFGVMRGGVVGHEGTSLEFGGGLGAELWFSERFFGRLSLAFLSGLDGSGSWGSASPLGVQPALSAGMVWRLGPLRAGPLVELAAPWRRVEIDLATTGDHEYSWWNFRAAAALYLRIEVTDVFSVTAEPGIGVYPKRRRFWLDPGDRTVYETPLLDWGLLIGLRFII